MSLIPSRRSNLLDPFTLDVWDPFEDFPFSNSLTTSFSGENSAFVNTRIDWKETPEEHVFKADVPGLKKEELKVEVEDDRVLQIRGEGMLRRKTRTTRGIEWSVAAASSGESSGYPRMLRWIRSMHP
ncbi:18.2 kDa class I heat shock protein [Spatholobus suberectus]|nr:18.2 kDa class I heat shock protein [Spatholobus suberectus]